MILPIYSSNFSLFHRFLLLHLSLTPSTFAHSSHCLLPPFPTFLLHAHSPPSTDRTQSVIPAHSVLCSFLLISPVCPTWLLPFSSPRPSRSFRPTRSTASFFPSFLLQCSFDSVGHSGPLSHLLPPYLSSLLFSLLLHHCLDSVGHANCHQPMIEHYLGEKRKRKNFFVGKIFAL